MLRIDHQAQPGGPETLRLAGRLLGPWVEELDRASHALLARGRTIALDLHELEWTDPAGAALLRRLARQRVALLNCPVFVGEQLGCGLGACRSNGHDA